MPTREQFETKEKIRRLFVSLAMKLCNDLNIRYNQEYNFIIEDLTDEIFTLATKREINEHSSE